MKSLKDNYALIIILVLLYALFFKYGSVNKDTSPLLPQKKDVVKNIHHKEKVIEHYTKEVFNKSEVSRLLKDFREKLMRDLDSAIVDQDTSRIVPIQSAIIANQKTDLLTKDSIITTQSSIISAKSDIIEGKDTLITILNSDLKKVKKQRNLSILLNVIQTGIIIIK